MNIYKVTYRYTSCGVTTLTVDTIDADSKSEAKEDFEPSEMYESFTIDSVRKYL